MDGWEESSHVSQVSTQARRITAHAYPEVLEAAPKLALQQIQQLLVEQLGVQLANPESGPVLARNIGVIAEKIADRGARGSLGITLGLEASYAFLGALMGKMPVCGGGDCLRDDSCARSSSGCRGGHRVLGGNIGMGGGGWGGGLGRRGTLEREKLTRDDWAAAQQNGAAGGVHVLGVVLGTDMWERVTGGERAATWQWTRRWQCAVGVDNGQQGRRIEHDERTSGAVFGTYMCERRERETAPVRPGIYSRPRSSVRFLARLSLSD